MGKCTPFADFLRAQPVLEVSLSFSEIEAILGTPLQPRAQHQRTWRSNNAANNVMTQAWLEAGFRTERVNMAARRLVFRRIDPEALVQRAGRCNRENGPVQLVNGHHPAFGALKDITRLVPGVDLTEPAGPDWADVAC